ncbi:ParB/RepB/Spo0J family partition protein [Sphingomonas profundi]|uniref:ParB/RepB/Spo0J family partition protein n=1 Tax=Alterirhizorhabdus profundi TaxID=2681549 RepID=UPI0012E8BB8E|nr:ParB/RepB/Spo0J family partition protein [Sphingomonas profundi]
MPSTTSKGTVTSATMTIDQIEVSPLNVRRHRATINAIAAMEASILGRGLIQPLNLHPMKGTKKFGAFAGGRRARAIRNLVDRGDLPADWPVRVEIYRDYSDIEIIELSLGENIQRADLELYEICAGIRALDARCEPAEAISTALGQPLALVRRWQRVGQLAEPIFVAFAEEKISGDLARAFAATTDHKLQLAVFEQLQGWRDYERTPEKVRSALKVGDRAAARLLRLVGADAYRAAGGRFELDLFADEAEQRGRIVDEGLLSQLANAQLDEARDATRAAVGRSIRFVPKPPVNASGYPDYTLQVTPKKGAEGKLVLPEGEVVAAIDLSEAGEPQVTYWWESRKAKFGSGSSAEARDTAKVKVKGAAAFSDPYHSAAPARALAKEEHGVSADALEVIRSTRRELLRAFMVEDAQRGGDAGRDFALWAQLRALLARGSGQLVGARSPAPTEHTIGIAFGALRAADEQLEQHVAHDVWLGAVREISAESFITEPDLAAAFVDFLNAGASTKRLAGAVLAGLTLERSANAPGFTLAPHDALAQFTRGVHAPLVRKLWSPTAEFLALLPKAQLLAIAEPLVGSETLARWSKVKAAELPGLLAQALNGAGNAVAARNRQAALEWIHPLLAFRQLDFKQPAPSAALAEAAE